MSHKRKKGGQRKDHKVHRMMEGEQTRKEEFEQKPPHPTTDQHDIQAFKPGGPSDKGRHLPPQSD